MDKDRVVGSVKQAVGSIKQGIGKLTGDQKLQTEGGIQKTSGKFQNAVGGAKDSIRSVSKKS